MKVWPRRNTEHPSPWGKPQPKRLPRLFEREFTHIRPINSIYELPHRPTGISISPESYFAEGFCGVNQRRLYRVFPFHKTSPWGLLQLMVSTETISQPWKFPSMDDGSICPLSRTTRQPLSSIESGIEEPGLLVKSAESGRSGAT